MTASSVPPARTFPSVDVSETGSRNRQPEALPRSPEAWSWNPQPEVPQDSPEAWSWDLPAADRTGDDLAPPGAANTQQRGSLDQSRLAATPDPGITVTPRLRLACAAAAVLAFLLGQAAAAVGLRLLGELATSAFLQFAPGVAFCLLARPAQRHLFALLSLVVGPSIVTLAATTAALVGAPDLRTVWVLLAVPTLAVLVLGGLREARTVGAHHRSTHGYTRPVARATGSAHRTGWSWQLLPAVLALSGLALALAAAAAHRGIPGPAGAAVTAGPLWFLGAVLVLAAVLVAWRQHAGLALPVLGLSTLVVASQAVMYREPAAVVAARHIGLVDYILVNGRLDRSTDIYQAWAGLFAAAALNVRAAGVVDLFGYAAWWGVVAAPVMVLVVRSLAGLFLDSRRAWLAALLFGLGSSLNTSFFAPQVLGFVMALTVLTLLAVPAGSPGALTARVRISTAALISIPLALTHQISPYMLTLALVALAVFGLVRPWWVVLVPAVPAVGWALVNLHLLGSYVSVSAFGRLLANLAPPENSAGVFPVPLVNRMTFLLPAAALVCIGLAALLVLLRSRSRLTWALAVTAASPVLLMAGTSYGQEGIFRVALFALPWLAVLACVSPTPSARTLLPARFSAAAFAFGVTALLAVQVVGLTGMDWARVIRPGDVAATQWVEQTAPAGSEILSLGTDLTLPDDSSARYTETNWASRTSLIRPPENPYPITTGPAYDAQADLAALTERLTANPASSYYAVTADSAGAYDERYGNQRYADHEKLADAIAISPRWQLVHTTPGVEVYRLRGAR